MNALVIHPLVGWRAALLVAGIGLGFHVIAPAPLPVAVVSTGYVTGYSPSGMSGGTITASGSITAPAGYQLHWGDRRSQVVLAGPRSGIVAATCTRPLLPSDLPSAAKRKAP